MLLHILKLIKTQRRSNTWVFIELLVVFVLLWYAVDRMMMNRITQAQPMEYSFENVYKVTLAVRPSSSASYIAYEKGSQEAGEDFMRIIRQLEAHPDVQVVGMANGASMPYTYMSNSETYFQEKDSLFPGMPLTSTLRPVIFVCSIYIQPMAIRRTSWLQLFRRVSLSVSRWQWNVSVRRRWTARSCLSFRMIPFVSV